MIASYGYKMKKIDSAGNASFVDRTNYINVPELCPMCHGSISPKYLNHNYNYDNDLFSVYYECTKCKRPFLAYYGTSNLLAQPCDGKTYPKFAKERNFDEEINALSPKFAKIYNQAVEAEAMELDEIAGMGYRKSLEFLIKDFCVKQHQGKEDEIKNKLLGSVISEYVESVKIKNLAKISAWIGNDETHYVRKNEDLDIDNLKKFIEAAVHYISYELLSEEAEELVESK